MADIVSNDYLIVDGVSSSTVGIYIDTPPVIPMATQRVTRFKTGIDADSYSSDNIFDSIDVTITAYLFFQSTDFNLSPVYSFFVNAKKIQVSRFADRYLRVRSVSGIKPVGGYDGKKIKMQISFVCDPFKYFTSNNSFGVTDPAVTNSGTRFSRPIYKITHTGACELVVNSQHLKIYATAPSPIYIDTERMIAYDSQNRNATMYTEGVYPFLESGQNTVYTTGTSTLEITGNWRDY